MGGVYLAGIDEFVFNPSWLNMSMEDTKDIYFYAVNDKQNNTISYSYHRSSDGVCVANINGLKAGVMHTNKASVYTDEWVEVGVDNHDQFEYETIVDVTSMKAEEFHNSLDFGKRSPICVVSNIDHEISSYLRVVRAEYPDWNIPFVINESNVSVKSIPKGEPDIKISKSNTALVRRIKPHRAETTREIKYSSHGTYIITGGLGYVGCNISKTLYENGARDIVLLSSTKSKLPDDWKGPRTVRVIQCDVSKYDDLKTVFSEISDIRGIFHAAGVLSDKTLPQLTSQDWKAVYEPKVVGAYNIDKFVREYNITPEFVVFCSSIASGFGTAGQGNYAAANGELDTLAQSHPKYMSIRWGAWLGGGMAKDETTSRAARVGIIGLDSDIAVQTFNALVSLIGKQEHADSRVYTVCPLEETRIPDTPYFKNIRKYSVNEVQAVDISIILSAKSENEQTTHVRNYILQACKNVGLEDFDNNTPWQELGLDSLSMIELVNALKKIFTNIPMTDSLLFDYPNVEALTRFLLKHLVDNQVDDEDIVEKHDRVEPIAIISIACRLPGHVKNEHEFFEFLMKSGNGMVPIERFDPTEFENIYVRHTATIDDPFKFDNKLFNISDSEALTMDPQQRILLECVQEALKNCSAKIVKKTTGVFIGASACDYFYDTIGSELNVYSGTGCANSILANRISYNFGFQGPSITMDTACSSSLVALHTGCTAIRNGDCSSAIIGGVQLNLNHHVFERFCKAKMLSPNGRCASFSDEADGYARGEGCGVLVIKNMKQALEDGDEILGVVCGTAVNQDGRSANLTSPNGPSQERCIRTALMRAGLNVEDIDFIEAHGTGTPIGDPQEIQSISNVFKKRKEKILVGSHKANIGHLESAAGITGVIKALMCLQNKTLCPQIHYTKPNPSIIPYLNKNIEIPTLPTALKSNKHTYYAGISSYGFGGTNAHAIIGFKG
jgi:3-oxoacyl-(acyl-carrier-protein) synthase/NADP-dependent 3-hydroxy acid dehydrogenase YdfG